MSDIDKRLVGTSGLSVAPLALGGNVFGWTADEATSFDLLDAFVDAGGTMIDTADVYSAWVPGHKGSESETVIGKWLKRDPAKRDRIVIATKVGFLDGKIEDGEYVASLEPKVIARAAQRIECTEAVGQRYAVIVLMLVIEVDRLDSEPLKRGLAGRRDRVGLEPRHEADLGRDHDPVALNRIAFQPLADHGFALAAFVAGHPRRIDIGGIDHSPTGFVKGVKHGKTGVEVSRKAEYVSAQNKRDASDRGV